MTTAWLVSTLKQPTLVQTRAQAARAQAANMVRHPVHPSPGPTRRRPRPAPVPVTLGRLVPVEGRRCSTFPVYPGPGFGRDWTTPSRAAVTSVPCTLHNTLLAAPDSGTLPPTSPQQVPVKLVGPDVSLQRVSRAGGLQKCTGSASDRRSLARNVAWRGEAWGKGEGEIGRISRTGPYRRGSRLHDGVW